MADRFDKLRQAVKAVRAPIGNMDPDGRMKALTRHYEYQQEALNHCMDLLDAHDKLAARLAWLHGPASNAVDGYEWGIFRVKWLNNGAGSVAEVQQTLNDFSDLDAAIQGSAIAGVAMVRNACGYCGQDMLPGSECTTSPSADRCSIYQEFAATRKADPGVALPRAAQQKGGA